MIPIILVLTIVKIDGAHDQVGTPDATVRRPAVQLSSSPAVQPLPGVWAQCPCWQELKERSSLHLLLGWPLLSRPATSLLLKWLSAEPTGALAKGRGQRHGHAHNSSQAPADRTPAGEAVEVQPEKRACRSGPATSHPAFAEEPDAEPAAEDAEAGEAKVQPKMRVHVRRRLSTSSLPEFSRGVSADSRSQV